MINANNVQMNELAKFSMDFKLFSIYSTFKSSCLLQ